MAPPPIVPDHPREDLTERLRKEFGLNIDESDGEEGESGGGLEALTARLQSAGRPEENKKAEAERESFAVNNNENRDKWNKILVDGPEECMVRYQLHIYFRDIKL